MRGSLALAIETARIGDPDSLIEWLNGYLQSDEHPAHYMKRTRVRRKLGRE